MSHWPHSSHSEHGAQPDRLGAVPNVDGLHWRKGAVISPEVQAGAELLDEKISKWYWLIDLDTLDIADPTGCVLGQLFEDYVTGLDTFDEIGRAAEYGFNAYGDGDRDEFEEYRSLTAQWREVITDRRRAAVATAQ